MKIGRIDIEQPVCLAPMDDVTDPPFRLLCKQFGADVLFTEFASSEALIRNVSSEFRKLAFSEQERPIGIQIYGSNFSSMERAAAIATAAGPDFIDVNCGCWVKKIANRGDGAGLLRDLKKLCSVVSAVQRGTHLPVTIKTRLGWDESSIVITELAPMLEALGVQALTVHCRTRSQGYSGKADWSWLPRIKETSNIPLIANGDICTSEDVNTCVAMGADGVMIGRHAMHHPWVFRSLRIFRKTGIMPPEPSLRERVECCVHHLRVHVAYRGIPRGVYSFRRYYGGYLKGVQNIAHLHRDLMEYTSVEQVIDRLYRFVESYEVDAYPETSHPSAKPCKNEA